MTLRSITVDSPVGPLVLVARGDAIAALRLPCDGAPDPHPDAVPGGGDAVLAEAARQLEEYFAGRRTDFNLPLDPTGTPFQLRAWEALRAIPYGTTVSYGEQAARMGDRGKARAVGAANGRNPIAIVVPCHRVVGADGSLTGFGGGLPAKAWLLAHERAVLPV